MNKKEKLTTKQIMFLVIGFALSIITLVLFSCGFSYVYNSKISGSEVSVSGYNLISAVVTWDFKNPSYGDIAVPFTYYAKTMTMILAILSTICFIIVTIGFLLSLLSLIIRNTKINLIAFNFLLCASIALFVTFIFSLFMGTTKIIPSYCGGNKACHMHSLIILPAITCFASAGMHALFMNNATGK